MSPFIWLGLVWTALRTKHKARLKATTVITGRIVQAFTEPPEPVPVLLSAPRVCAARQTAATKVKAFIDQADYDGPVRRMLLAYGWDSALA